MDFGDQNLFQPSEKLPGYLKNWGHRVLCYVVWLASSGKVWWSLVFVSLRGAEPFSHSSLLPVFRLGDSELHST